MHANMETSSETTVETSNNCDQVAVEQKNSSIEHEKRPLEEFAEGNESEPKKCKTNNDNDDNKEIIKTGMSKRQSKMALKQQKWLEQKEKRREMNKLKKLQKKQYKATMRESGIVVKSRILKTKMADSKCKQRIVLDMAYDDLMTTKDLCKCSSQILRCYGMNRRMENPMQFYICSYEGKIKETMAKHNGCEFWDIRYQEDPINKIFKEEEMVYLTSDSLNVLDSLDDSKVYIIGGLVDHNAHKGASLKAAENLGISHARLPIDKYINMQTRKILTINHVFEIMTKVVAGQSWKEAFMTTIPKRKMFSAMDEDDSSNSKSEENNNPNSEEKGKDIEDIKEENNKPNTEENDKDTEENNKPNTEESNNPNIEEENHFLEPLSSESIPS